MFMIQLEENIVLKVTKKRLNTQSGNNYQNSTQNYVEFFS